jgi:RimJ/RimL family protein N-acetyltransferase
LLAVLHGRRGDILIDMENAPRLETERLLLRPFQESDAVAVERLAGVREVADTTLNIPHPYPAGGGLQWIATHGAAWARRQNLTLAICSQAPPNDLLGAINLSLSLMHLHGEIGYWIGASSWGHGFATEASRALVAYAFDELGLHRVQGRHFIRNPASGRVLQKLGMSLEGVHRDAYRRWGAFESVALYAVLAPDWYAARERERHG